MSVPFVTRAEWGAKPRVGNAIPIVWDDQLGIAVHWPGEASTPNDHANCAQEVRNEQASQMNRGYRDIAYNALICKHGYVFEGRWLNDTDGANGTTQANDTYFAVSFMIGETEPAPGIMWTAFQWIRSVVLGKNSHATDVQPHSHFVADQCPGNLLRQDIVLKKYIAPAPVQPTVSLSNLQKAAHIDPTKPNGYATYSAGTKIVQAALHKEVGLNAPYPGSFGLYTVKAYAEWQHKLGYSGAAADGIPGSASLTKLGSKYSFRVSA